MSLIRQILEQIVYIEEHTRRTGEYHYKLVKVPKMLYSDVLNLQQKFKHQFGIDVCVLQPHAGNSFSYEIDLSWKPETVNLIAINAYINFQYSKAKINRLEMIEQHLNPK